MACKQGPPKAVSFPSSKGIPKPSENQEVLVLSWVVLSDEGSPVHVHNIGVTEQLQKGSSLPGQQAKTSSALSLATQG